MGNTLFGNSAKVPIGTSRERANLELTDPSYLPRAELRMRSGKLFRGQREIAGGGGRRWRRKKKSRRCPVKNCPPTNQLGGRRKSRRKSNKKRRKTRRHKR